MINRRLTVIFLKETNSLQIMFWHNCHETYSKRYFSFDKIQNFV